VDVREVDLFVHRALFELECYRRTGTAFQSFFERIMEYGEPGFVTVKPWGAEGDRKCDGLLPSSGTLFQVYAPEEIRIGPTRAKMEADCAGALAAWEEMHRWIFVWSALPAGLPPDLAACLLELADSHPGLEIADWNRERLWRVVQDQLDEVQRASLLGPPRRADSAAHVTAVEIQTVLNFLASGPVGPDPEDSFEITDLKPKLEKNRLSAQIETIAGRAIPIAREVERYLARSYDPDFMARVGSRLIGRYQELVGEGITGDPAFIDLIEFAMEGRGRGDRNFWGAAGIVTYYFEICDVFER
jgi:hypothetical protein